VREGIIPILLLLAGFRFIILSTAYIIPTYLQVVQNYREMQVGAVLLWIALPQLLIVFPLGWLLSRVDARLVLTLGASLICAACLMVTNLTADWATDDFLPSQLLQALGQSFALTALVVIAVRSMNPTDVLTIGTLVQTSRLFGGEIGTAFMQTFVRVREQVHSNLIGLHVDSLGGLTADGSQRRCRRLERTSREPVGLGCRETGRHPGVYRRLPRCGGGSFRLFAPGVLVTASRCLS
jgi:DHA2 family multidrug resistance protein